MKKYRIRKGSPIWWAGYIGLVLLGICALIIDGFALAMAMM